MEVDAFVRRTQADGHRVTDEVNLMAARREFNAQLSGYDTRTAICGITGDSDFHGTSGHCNSHPSRGASVAVRLPWLAPGAAGCQIRAFRLTLDGLTGLLDAATFRQSSVHY